MKILLVYTNRHRDLAPPPAGIAFLVEPLCRDGHEVKVLDLMFSEDPADDLKKALEAFRPDVAGFSYRNLDNQDMGYTAYYAPILKEYVDMARQKKIITVLGGPAFTIFPAETLSFTGADYGIAGQGDKSLPLLLKTLGNGHVDETISGLVWRANGGVRVNPPDFSGYAGVRADWHLIDLNRYRGGILAGSVVTKTGCPFKCSFCPVPSHLGDRFTFRDTADIVEEIKYQKGLGMTNFTLIDPCFNVPLRYAKKVLRAIAAADLGIRLATQFVPVPGHYDDEFFELFNEAGGGMLSLGVEAFSEKMLKSYNKPCTMEDVRACAGLCNRHHIPFMVHAIFGGPGEDEETLKESMAAVADLHCTMFIYLMGVRILPGTRLYEVARREGVVKDAAELFEPKFYMSKDLDIGWADGYIKSKLEEYGL